MADGGGSVLRLGEEDVPEIVDVLCESFFDYPLMLFVLGPKTGDYEPKLRTLINFFVTARVLREETLLGIGDRPNLDGAALVSRPTRLANPEKLEDLRERVWAELGTAARARYEAFGAPCAQFQIDIPHIHLNMIGVCRKAQGRGLGRLLMEHVHVLSERTSSLRASR